MKGQQLEKKLEDPDMSPNPDKVAVEIDSQGVAWVTLNEPAVRNALSPELRAQFCERIPQLEFNSAVRCVVLQGAGDHFMAGWRHPGNERTLEVVQGGEITAHHCGPP